MTEKGRGDAKGEHTTLKGGLSRKPEQQCRTSPGRYNRAFESPGYYCWPLLSGAGRPHAINPRRPYTKGRAGCGVYYAFTAWRSG
ncbi:hypothetical protein SBC2_02210 [Caballeronia sp. SBC2]|nr:hypothetical protein SBC2_02210 [Caballeronia sp. SBC2]